MVCLCEKKIFLYIFVDVDVDVDVYVDDVDVDVDSNGGRIKGNNVAFQPLLILLLWQL